MKPSFLFINTYYPAFLEYFYNRNKEIVSKNYNEQKTALMNELFGTVDFYSSNLIKLGYQAEDVVANNETLQKQWAKEQKVKFNNFPNLRLIRRFPFINNLIQTKPRFYFRMKDFIYGKSWTYQILMAQIKEYRPDVLYIFDLGFLSPSFLKEAKRYVKTIIGQIGTQLPPKNFLQPYDLILSCAPHLVERFRKMGINSEYLKLAFEPRVLEMIGSQERKYQCTFIGGITLHHTNTIPLLEELAQKVDIDFWGYGIEFLNKSSPIIPKHHGPAWGKEMYKIFGQSKITINRHIDIAKNYAANMRLYEATGLGTMLITEMKDNLGEIFEIGREVETYSSPEELIEKIKYYSQHDKKREEIARAGQKRTLKEHTYLCRAQKITGFINQYLYN